MSKEKEEHHHRDVEDEKREEEGRRSHSHVCAFFVCIVHSLAYFRQDNICTDKLSIGECPEPGVKNQDG